MLKEIHTPKKIQIYLKIILCLSAPFFTILLSNRFDMRHILIGALLSLIIQTFIILKEVKLNKINVFKLIISLLLSLYLITKMLIFSQQNTQLVITIVKNIFTISMNNNTANKIIGILALPNTIFWIYIFINQVYPIAKKFLVNLTKSEKHYLLSMFMIGTILAISLTFVTSVFSKPTYNGYVINYDVLYTSDTGSLVKDDTFLNVSFVENDIRQPLFGVFALPFSLIAHLISDICFFLPTGFEYAVILTIIQFLLTTISTILLSRLLKINEKDKKYLYILFSVSFPYIIFNLILEQYVISMFYLILAIYLFFQNKEKTNYMYIGAVGTMITSGIIVPLISKFKPLKQWIINVSKCFIVFVSIFIITGQFPQIFTGISKLTALTGEFIGQVSFYDKTCQFTNFMKGIFLSEPGHIEILNNYPTYQLNNFISLSIIGIIIFLIVTLGYILNRKNNLAKISYLWVLFSIIILLFMGWGTLENGLILYSLYFAWAYLILFFLFIKKIFKNPQIFKIIFSIIIIVMLICNLKELKNIIEFSLSY